MSHLKTLVDLQRQKTLKKQGLDTNLPLKMVSSEESAAPSASTSDTSESKRTLKRKASEQALENLQEFIDSSDAKMFDDSDLDENYLPANERSQRFLINNTFRS